MDSTAPSDAPAEGTASATRRAATLETLRARGALACPPGLPLAERRDDLLAALRDHQVVVVAGETGSGKSTQLPKLCLEIGRGVHGLIGHTQPRRVAARTIAERVAFEVGTPLGSTVGYSVRFTDVIGEDTMVRVMTDGILLTEIQRDRMLRRYDTIIIDEAHERSLNIDFLLGYLRQLLPRRPDLKLVITSATIDTERFAEHFGTDGVPAPVVEVSGRTYPVEVRYRPYGAAAGWNDDDRLDDGDPGDEAPGRGRDRPRTEDTDERDQVQAVIDAVAELADPAQGGGPGDVLVFLSGEREIHDTADALRRDATERFRQLEVLPLYARLSAPEQHRIFQPHQGRRVVLATNVAETSLTVPGVRYVVDAGTARVSRYSHRLKVQRLPIEPVSQASANQRAGRCGRVAPGICIRLYPEDDFATRPEFTEPEILRTNLASVILQMTALGLGDVAAFPFLDPPDPRAVRDGYGLLEELGALEPPDPEGRRRLTAVGRRLARLPVDPRLGRMVLEADRLGCVRDVMIIASALSIQDVRERPAEHRGTADELHRRFEVPGSDFLAYVKLWDHLREQQQALSGNQFRKLCRTEFLHYLRVREWMDLYSQLRQVAGQVGVRSAKAGRSAMEAHPDHVHQALMSGLLSHLGMRDGTTREYRGAHGSKFMVSPGSVVARSLPRWVMAAELVETSRLWGRVAAGVEPEWAEQLAPHLVRRSYGEPWWDERRAGAVCRETVTLLGLQITNRVVGYDRVDPAEARAMFIRTALVEGDWQTHQKAVLANREFLRDLAAMAERMRRADVVDEAAVFAFYDARLAPSVVSGRHFDRWWKDARRTDPDLLTMRLEHFAGARGAIDPDGFPTVWRQGALELAVTYRFDPGSALDGATVHVPLAALNQVGPDGFDWGVPGFREDLVDALVRSLPKEYRRELTPMNEVVVAVAARLGRPEAWEDGTSIAAALATVVHEVSGVRVPSNAFDAARVPAHLRITFSVDDEGGRSLGHGKELAELQEQLGPRVRAAIARSMPIEERTGITAWDVGDLPRTVETTRDGVPVRGYPALLDDGDSVRIRVLTDEGLQRRVQHGGVRRLLLLAVPVGNRAVDADLTNERRLAIARAGFDLGELRADSLLAAADRVVSNAVEVPFTSDAFDALVAVARAELPVRAARAMRLAADVLAAAASAEARLERLVAPGVQTSADDARAHLRRLVRPGFVASTGTARMKDLVRYVQAIDHRLAKLPEDPHRDAARLREVAALEARYTAALRRMGRHVPPEAGEVGWLLEELRVATFAQQLGAAKGTSVARVAKAIAALP
ncbi:MAG: ATP-dependent RNA helicase HrpA [Ilumatobacter sp.]|nr:ATP-dependent RNA helicase HrpA [Ilumatobacter sp.]